jgi:Ni/Co efflux regulator RcnB
MNKPLLVGFALIIPAALSAQVHRPVHPVPRAPVVAHPIYHPGTWNRARINAGRFVYPRGYAYRRWTVGRVLPRVFLVPTYYYRGYAALGLAVPPANYQWVRYGPDLLLVSIGTGNIVDIRYGVFA